MFFSSFFLAKPLLSIRNINILITFLFLAFMSSTCINWIYIQSLPADQRCVLVFKDLFRSLKFNANIPTEDWTHTLSHSRHDIFIIIFMNSNFSCSNNINFYLIDVIDFYLNVIFVAVGCSGTAEKKFYDVCKFPQVIDESFESLTNCISSQITEMSRL